MPKDNDFFLAIGKEGIHSFIMLGVLDKGQPRLLARIAKSNDIDKDFKRRRLMAFKALIGTKARIRDELDKNIRDVTVHYQAYSINLKQAREFLKLVQEIEKIQINEIAPEEISYREGIECRIPYKDQGEIRFTTLQNLQDYDFSADEPSSPTVPIDEDLINSSKTIKRGNNCRTTALTLTERILGFKTSISKLFFIDPKYTLTLHAGPVPIAQNAKFYILPPPPPVSILNATEDPINQKKMRILNKLYKRLEAIPSMHTQDDVTQSKFNKLKDLYNIIIGQLDIPIENLLQNIVAYAANAENKESLFKHRGGNFFNSHFHFNTSTEKMFKKMEEELQSITKLKGPS